MSRAMISYQYVFSMNQDLKQGVQLSRSIRPHMQTHESRCFCQSMHANIQTNNIIVSIEIWQCLSSQAQGSNITIGCPHPDTRGHTNWIVWNKKTHVAEIQPAWSIPVGCGRASCSFHLMYSRSLFGFCAVLNGNQKIIFVKLCIPASKSLGGSFSNRHMQPALDRMS